MGKIKWMYEITKEKKGKYLKRKSLFILGLLFWAEAKGKMQGD